MSGEQQNQTNAMAHPLIPLDRASGDDIQSLFEDIDTNHDGKISLEEMRSFVRQHKLPFSEASLEHFYKAMDGDMNGAIELNEFRQYVIEKEIYLQRLFKQIDENDDGHIDRKELKKALHALNLKASEKQIDELMGQVSDLDSSTIRYEAWRAFLLILPTNDIREIFDYWQKASGIDIGENFSVPDETGKNKHPGKLLFAGALAGAISRTATAPLDRLKMLLQVNSAQYSGIFQGMRAIHQQGGWKAFFRGNGTNVIKIAPESAFKFFAYDKIKGLICSSAEKPTTVERMMSGSLAGLTAQAFVYPLETIKTRLATAPTGMYTGISHAASTILRQEGFRFFYRGIIPASIGVIPYAGIDLAVYESLKNYYSEKEQQPPGTMTLLACGTMSSTAGMSISYPLAVVRTRLQASGIPGNTQYTGMMDVVHKTLQNEGPKGFFKGLFANYLKVVPAVSISYAIFENTKRFLKVD